MLEVPLQGNPNSLEVSQDEALEMAQEMSRNYMRMLYQSVSQQIGFCIMQTGLVGRQDTKGMTRLIRAACMGAHRATLEEADKIAKERLAKRTVS